MFRALLLVSLLAISSYAFNGHIMAPTPANTPCDYSTGHGFVFFSPNYAAECDSFILYHLGELECPHQYIVVAEVTVQQSVKDLYCKKINAGNETVFSVAPEFILPQFIGGQITSFTSQFYEGFFTTVLIDSMTAKLQNIIYGQMINVIPTNNLGYYLYQDSRGNLFMSHVITTAPDFDQLMLVTVTTDAPSNSNTNRKGPVYVQFDAPNSYENRLVEGQERRGKLYEVDGRGVMQTRSIRVVPVKNIYPGPNHLNGDGKTDFQQFCVEPSKPMWDSCKVFSNTV